MFNLFTFHNKGFLPGFGAIAGSVIGTGASIGESLSLGDQNMPPLNINPGDIKKLDHIIENIKNKKLDQLNGLLEHIETDLEEYRKEHNNSDELKDLEELVKNIKQKLSTVSDVREIRKLEKELEAALEKKQKELGINALGDKKKESALDKVKGMMDKLKAIGSIGIDLYNQYKNDKGQLAAINNAIRQREDMILKLRQYEDEVYEIIIPMLKDMQSDLKKIAESLKNKSRVQLDITKWKSQTRLRDMKLEMHELTAGFQVESSLARLIEKQEETMNTLINIYDRIDNYHDQQELGDYIGNICSAGAKRIQITDQNLANSIDELEIAIRSNILIKQYTSTINALKQWVFPFAKVYLQELKRPDQFKLDNNLDNQVEEAKAEIEKINRKIKIYKTSVQKSDEYIHNGEFSSEYVSTNPFYVWKNENNNEMLSKLLSGEEVLFKADILNSPIGKNGIKFNLVELNFKIPDQEKNLQAELNEKLKLFLVNAIHLGNSYYRCDKKIYSISSPSQTIEYSLEKKEDGTPVDQNVVYKKIKDGDLMLSPYALWKFRLVSTKNAEAFKELEKFKGKIDLELTGLGGYISNAIDASELNIEDYYKSDDTIIKEIEYDENLFIKNFKGKVSRPFSKFFHKKSTYLPNEMISTSLDFEKNTNNELKLINSTKEENFLNKINSSSIDTFGNLILGQMVVGKLFGSNKYLSGHNYVSPDLRREMKINELGKRISQVLKEKEDEYEVDLIG